MSGTGNSLRVLQVHNEYFSGLGGEDTVLALEHQMLIRHGHAVEQVKVSTSGLRGAGPFKLFQAAVSTPWSVGGYKMIQGAIHRFAPDVMHVHNTFPLLSPSVYWAAHRLRIPIVQTYHNYRMFCANGVLLRDGSVCEACIGRSPLPGLLHRCYKGSLAFTAPLVAAQFAHRLLDTLATKIDAHIALTEFARQKLIEAGLPSHRIHVKSNFSPPRAVHPRRPNPKQQVAFLGQITSVKGVDLLLEAWKRLNRSDARLIVIGDGAERVALQSRYPDSEALTWKGWLNHDEAMEVLDASSFLVLPTRVYEGLPMVMVEAFAAGTPVVLPDHGAFPQLLNHGQNGLLFQPGDLDSLTATLGAALAIDPAAWSRMSQQCAQEYRASYTEEANYPQMMAIYSKAIRGESTADVNEERVYGFAR